MRELRAGTALGASGRVGQPGGGPFLDPPYESPRMEPALAALAEGAVLEAGAVVVLQHASKSPPPDAVGIVRLARAKKFGETTHPP